MHASTRDINRCLRTRENLYAHVCMYACVRACMCITSLLIRQRVRAYLCTYIHRVLRMCIHLTPSPSRFTRPWDAYNIFSESENVEGPLRNFPRPKTSTYSTSRPEREFTFSYSTSFEDCHSDEIRKVDTNTHTQRHIYKCIVKV